MPLISRVLVQHLLMVIHLQLVLLLKKLRLAKMASNPHLVVVLIVVVTEYP